MLICASQLIYMYSDRTTLTQSGAKYKSGGLKKLCSGLLVTTPSFPDVYLRTEAINWHPRGAALTCETMALVHAAHGDVNGITQVWQPCCRLPATAAVGPLLTNKGLL